MQVASTPIHVAAPPSAEQLQRLDLSAPLQPMNQLDVVPDGRLTTQDGAVFEALAQAARGAAALAPTTGAQGGAGPLRITWDGAGSLDPAGRTRAQLVELASQLHWAGQQARYGAALLEPGAPLPTSTVHNIVPTPSLDAAVTPPELIGAIRQVDVGRLRAAGVDPVAAFDIDGTTIKGDIFIPFTELMAQQGRFGAKANEVFRATLAKLDVDQDVVARNDANANARLLLGKIDHATKTDTPSRLSVASAFFAVGSALEGIRLDEVQGVARDLMEHGVGSTPPYRQNINDDSPAAGDGVKDVVAALKQQGITPHVVTYGFDWLAKVATEYVGFDTQNLVGTHSEVKDGILTGVHDGPTIPSKDVLVRDAVGSPPLFVFGDSGSDLPMLDVATARGIVVNPTDAMREKMSARGGALGEVRYSGTVGSTS